jgi:adenylosuccinate lyase
MQAYNKQIQFKTLLLRNKVIMDCLSKQDINNCFDLAYYFKNVSYIYKKVGL